MRVLGIRDSLRDSYPCLAVLSGAPITARTVEHTMLRREARDALDELARLRRRQWLVLSLLFLVALALVP